MYYQTQVKKIRAGSVVDVNGKVLYSIGNFTCKEGDFVWTDGKFVFGHTPARSTPIIINDSTGIPILCSDARGYIKPNGKFKDYSIYDAEWIVNTDKNFASGNDNIIDAEIDDNGDLWTVTNGFYRYKSVPTFHNHLYTQTYRLIREQEEKFSVCSKVTPYVGQLFDYPAKSFADIPAEDTYVIFYKNGEQQFTVNLKQFANIAESFALDAKDLIMNHSNKEDDAVNWTMQPAPPDDFIALSYASIVTLHISRNGDWDAIISTAAMGFCFPYLTSNGSIFYKSFPNVENQSFSEDLIKGINNFEDVVFNQHSLPFQPNFEQYPAFTEDEKDANDNYTTDFQKYILDKVAYYIPLAKFRYYYWFPIIFSACKILKVHNGTVTDTIYQSHGGGNVIYSPEWDEKESVEAYYNDFVYNDSNGNSRDITFPLDDDFYFTCQNNMYLYTVYKASSTTFDIPYSLADNLKNSTNAYCAYGQYQGYYYSLIDSTSETIATQNNISIDNLFGRQIFIPALFYEYVGLNEEDYNNNLKKDNYPYMSGWFKSPTEDTDDAVINYCFTELKNGGFLLGVHGGDLYKVDAEINYKKVGDGLKNFRLRELKNISNARK